MPAQELAAFERETRRAYQHHSLIDLIVAIANRRAQLEREGWCRIRPSYVGAAIHSLWLDGAEVDDPDEVVFV